MRLIFALSNWSRVLSVRVSFVTIYFFFFKQKTAYEMRISDWSSDVCSSDLLDRLREGILLARPDPVEKRCPDLLRLRFVQALEHHGKPQRVVRLESHLLAPVRVEQAALVKTDHLRDQVAICRIRRYQLVRASCRARVCQYE